MGSQGTQGLDASSLFSVNGLVALVTGGGSGIGLMITKALAQNGAAKVYIAGRRLEVLENAAKAIGPTVVPVQCDVTSKDSLQAAAERIRQETGYLNLLVCNSGIGGPQVPLIKEETTVEEWADQNFAIPFEDYTRTFAVNASSVWFTSMACLKLLDEGNKRANVKQSSQVVVLGSISAFNKKAPGGYAYGQSKAAASLAVKHLSVALPKWKIRANCIAPGLYPSEMSAPIVKKYTSDSGEQESLPAEMIPMQRMGDDQDMAGTILYLASRAGGYCNGVTVTTDGGRLGTFPSVF